MAEAASKCEEGGGEGGGEAKRMGESDRFRGDVSGGGLRFELGGGLNKVSR